MESKVLMGLLVLLGALCLGSAMSIPDEVKHNELQVDSDDEGALQEKERATWLDTRDLEDEFKELVYLAVRELQNEGRVADGVVKSNPKDKRGRWQGFCFRRTRSGRFLPYICWKGGK